MKTIYKNGKGSKGVKGNIKLSIGVGDLAWIVVNSQGVHKKVSAIKFTNQEQKPSITYSFESTNDDLTSGEEITRDISLVFGLKKDCANAFKKALFQRFSSK
jgi:hypothetical protein